MMDMEAFYSSSVSYASCWIDLWAIHIPHSEGEGGRLISIL